jgi:formate hydrogenlyase subunit 3/multisubunit Na+/H+ antiporter MnhD subunit
MSAHLTIAPVLLPLLAGIVLLLLRHLDIRVRRVLSVAAVVMEVALAIALLAAVADGPSWSMPWATGRPLTASSWWPIASRPGYC